MRDSDWSTVRTQEARWRIDEMENASRTSGKVNSAGRKPRMANLELLRCIAMMMVVVLHYLGKGNLLGDLSSESMTATGILAWVLEMFCIVAVNVYMLLSGYFLCTSTWKVSRLIKLLLQVWTYSVVIGLLAVVTGIYPMEDFSLHYLFTLFFPVSMGHYWFMTAYVFLYILLPLFGGAVRKMTKQQMQVTLVLLFVAFCILKSVLPVRLEMDGKGYDCLWYLCMFLMAAYIRRFGMPVLNKKGRCLLGYVVCCLLIFAGTFGLRLVYLKTGSLEHIMKICIEYNHILPAAAAVLLLGFFLQVQVSGKAAELINKIAPYTLGVYLLHENIGVRYAWQQWFGATRITSPAGLVMGTVTAVVCVFALGVAVEALRTKCMSVLGKVLDRWSLFHKLNVKISELDGLFAE